MRVPFKGLCRAAQRRASSESPSLQEGRWIRPVYKRESSEAAECTAVLGNLQPLHMITMRLQNQVRLWSVFSCRNLPGN